MHRRYYFLSIVAIIATLWAMDMILRIREHQNQLLVILKKCTDRITFLKRHKIYKNNGRGMRTNTWKLHSEINVLPKLEFMTHVNDNPKALVPALWKTRNRTNVTMVLGIVTTARSKVSSLNATLNNLINNMNEVDKYDTLIIILIEGIEWSIVGNILMHIEDGFAHYMETGLIDVIAPHPSYYPNFQNLCLEMHNDVVECAQWRIELGLNIIYLMAYAQNRGSYYVQLDDDISSIETNFLNIMKHFVHLANNEEPSWIVLDFCEDDIIGKTFKSENLPNFIIFMEMFYNYMPFHKMLNKYVEVKVCSLSPNYYCTVLKRQYWWKYYPSLFYRNQIKN